MAMITRFCIPILLLIGGFTPGATRAAESFDSCAGFIDSVPATLTTQGVWCLRHDLSTAITSGRAIDIAANNVTIDCNGFKLGGLAAGTSSQASGIFTDNALNATIRNCNIRGFYRGISLADSEGGGHLVEDNRLDNNLTVGISVLGENNLVQRNRIYATGGSTVNSVGTGIGITASASIIGNIVSNVFGIGSGHVTGISAQGFGDTVRDNEVTTLISDATGSNTVVGIHASDNGQRIVDNQVSGLHAAPTGATVGILASGTYSHVIGNQLIGSGEGQYAVRGTGAGTLCARNTASNFATPYSSCEVSADNLPAP
jgi:hypothetical protein